MAPSVLSRRTELATIRAELTALRVQQAALPPRIFTLEQRARALEAYARTLPKDPAPGACGCTRFCTPGTAGWAQHHPPPTLSLPDTFYQALGIPIEETDASAPSPRKELDE